MSKTHWREYASLADVEKIVSTLTWLWPGVIPNGYLTVIAGQPGIAKSAWALDVVARLLSGEPWPNGSSCKQVEFVVWADTEATQAMLLDRAKCQGIDTDRIIFPFDKDNVLGDVRLDRDEDWSVFKSAVEDLNPPAVIIDSLASAHNSDEDKAKNMNLICGRLMRLARDQGCALTAIHQIRKKGDEYITNIRLDDLRGSGAIGYHAKCVSVIEPINGDEPQGMRRFRPLKSNLGAFADDMAFETDESRLVWVPAPGAEERERKLAQAVGFLRRELLDCPVLMVEIQARAARDKLAWSTVGRAKKELGVESFKPKGEKHAPWWWRLPSRSSSS